MSTPLAMAFDEHRATMSTVRGSAAVDNSIEPVSPPLPPSTPDASSSLHSTRSISLGLTCFCGHSLESKRKSGMFCSMDCARNGTFSSLTTHHRLLPSAATTSQLSEPFVLKDSSRVPSAFSDYVDESSPHPRAMARADQRREERRRRRADPIDVGVHSPMICRSSTCPDMPTSNMPTASPTFVPDLVSSHSRNTSSASSIFSLASGNALSRNGSICSSHHRQPSTVAIGAAIMEVDGEDSPEMALARSTLKARACARRNQAAFRRSATGSTLSASSSSDLRVHDMLDELIQMEQSFRVHDPHTIEHPTGDDFHVAPPPQRVATPVFTPLQRPPRTPSPVNSGSVMVPPAPGAPDRRNSLTDSRPSSTFAHQSSLSESHTALYLATASPLHSSTNERNRRSASPQLNVRRSIVFTPSHAGPILPPSPRRFDSPSRRKPVTTAVQHPVMNNWRFPKTEFDTDMDGQDDDEYDDDLPEPTGLLWPQGNSSGFSNASGLSSSSGFTSSSGFSYASSAFSSSSGLNLSSAAAFPTSRASMNLAELATNNRTMVPPRSGLRLNMLLSSSNDDDADIDMESEVSDGRSTVRGSVFRQSFTSPTPSFAQRGW